MGNGLKFTERGQVELRLVGGGGGTVKIHVIDSGPGVSPETIDHIFEPFWQDDGSLTRSPGERGWG